MAYQRICAVYGDQDDEPDLDELKKDERVTCMLGTVKKVSSDNVRSLSLNCLNFTLQCFLFHEVHFLKLKCYHDTV